MWGRSQMSQPTLLTCLLRREGYSGCPNSLCMLADGTSVVCCLVSKVPLWFAFSLESDLNTCYQSPICSAHSSDSLILPSLCWEHWNSLSLPVLLPAYDLNVFKGRSVKTPLQPKPVSPIWPSKLFSFILTRVAVVLLPFTYFHYCNKSRAALRLINPMTSVLTADNFNHVFSICWVDMQSVFWSCSQTLSREIKLWCHLGMIKMCLIYTYWPLLVAVCVFIRPLPNHLMSQAVSLICNMLA